MQPNNPKFDRDAPSILDTAATVVSREFHHFINDLESLIKSANSDDKSAFERASANLQTRARALKHRVEDMSEDLQASAYSGVKTADEFAHKRPWYLAGIGACIGLAVGIALTKRD